VIDRRLGWRKQLHDGRDFLRAARGATVTSLPTAVDLRDSGPIFDQGRIGSCVANACATVMGYHQRRAGGPWFIPSRLFIYYNARALQGWENEDSGAYIRDGMKSLAIWGTAAEGRYSSGSWEYDTQRFYEKPSVAAYNHAANHQAITYYTVAQTNSQIRGTLAEGYPIAFGFEVYDSFYYVGSDGIVEMPGPQEQPIGGHAVTLVGYNDSTRRYLVQNSWGESWGDGGFFHMPYAYVEGLLSDDFWMLTAAEPGLGKEER
jgi:C1A family cysteine protease